jgi:glycosyltransferase involved in cell wall biosynthesis
MALKKILHILGQRPEMTGSGIYLEALIRESEKRGYSNYWVAGVPVGADQPPRGMAQVQGAYVYFESDHLDFPVPGMSDVMPYRSTLFKDLSGKRLTVYKTAFAEVLDVAVADFNPDIIHTNHLFLLSALARGLFPTIPMVTTCHGTDLRQYHNCHHLRSFVRRHCRKLDRIIALTNDQKIDISRTLDIPPGKIVVVGGGYDEKTFTRAPKSPAGTVHILYAGKFNRSKGVPWLLKSLLNISHYDWHLDMAGGGSGPEFEECLELADKLGEKVTNHGYVSHRKLSELMKKAHLQLLPSFFEGLPLVLFEGLASGCRIITTNLTGFGEIFGKASGDTIDLIQLPPLETIDRPYIEDEAELETALSGSILKKIATIKESPDFNDPQADDIASHYTWPKIFDRTLSVYLDVFHQVVFHPLQNNR